MSFTRIGYGQVEPNHLAGQKTGQIYASLPLDNDEDSAVTVLQNGEFMFYDEYLGKVTATDANVKMTEPYLVWNEIKLYEDYLALKDFAMIRVGDNYVTNNAAVGRVTSANTDGTVYGGGSTTVAGVTVPHVNYGYQMNGIAPRLMRTFVGDIYTTNMLKEGDNITYAKGDVLALTTTDRNTLELAKASSITTPVSSLRFIITKVYTMPDGQTGFKLQRIA